MKEFVLVSQGMEMMRTKSQEVAINEVKKANDEWFDYKQRCEDNYEDYADNYVELFIEDEHTKKLEHNWNELKKHIETKIKIINETYLDYEEEWNEDFIADIYSRKIAYENILEKIEELEEGGNNEC